MLVIRKPWQGHNDVLLSRQVRTSSGATNLPERLVAPCQVIVIATAPPQPEMRRIVPIWLLDAQRGLLSDRAHQLLIVLETVARIGEVMPIEDDIVVRVGLGVTMHTIRRFYYELEESGHICRSVAGPNRSIELVQLGMVIANHHLPRVVTA
jgi:hypothetical protein